MNNLNPKGNLFPFSTNIFQVSKEIAQRIQVISIHIAFSNAVVRRAFPFSANIRRKNLKI